jgi:hypothetical protein
MSAVISPCGNYRLRLDRDCGMAFEGGRVFAYFGVNPSTADDVRNDPTVSKWIGFTKRNGGNRFIVANVFSYRSTDVRALAHLGDAVFGPDHWLYINQIIAEADVLVPCWGATTKVPKKLRGEFKVLLDVLHQSGKPVLHFGKSTGGDPLHPQFLPYSTPLIPLEPT